MIAFFLDNHIATIFLLVIAFYVYNFVDSKNGKLNIDGEELMKRYIYVETIKKKRNSRG